MRFIDRPRTVWWRQAAFQIHLWTGIALGLYVIVISVSGSAIVFGDRITRDVTVSGSSPHAARHPLALDALVALARAQNPVFTAPAEILADPANGVYTIRMSNGTHGSQYTTLDASGTVLATVNSAAPRHAVVDFLTALHTELLGGRAGSIANGAGGAALALLAVTGIVVWWPGRKGWTRALTIKSNAGPRRLLFDLHTAGGFWTSLFVATFALTGVALVFFTAWLHLVAAVLPTTTATPVPPSRWQSGERSKPLAQLVARAAALEPALRWDLVEVAAGSGDATIVRLVQPGIPLRLSRHAFVYLDPADGSVLQDWRSANRTFGDLVTWYVVEGLHYGDYGTVMQCAWVVVGLAPAGLALTSIALWWTRLGRWQLRLAKRRHGRMSS